MTVKFHIHESRMGATAGAREVEITWEGDDRNE